VPLFAPLFVIELAVLAIKLRKRRKMMKTPTLRMLTPKKVQQVVMARIWIHLHMRVIE
jgi:hypothetical protein